MVIGDGVNDVLVLCMVDIGIVMGFFGIDVVCEVVDIVLFDDYFGIIVNVIEEGWVVYENICKFIIYIFILNILELIFYFVFVFFCILLLLIVI